MTSFWNIPIAGPAVYAVWRLDAQRKLAWIAHALSRDDKIIEIGSGPGSIVDVMRAENYTVAALDIRDTSFRDDLKPDLYDGSVMPYADDHFDAALLLTMLHHTPDPESILMEAGRIARRVIVIEDVYRSALQRRYTKLADKVTNLEFFGHPHTNRTEKAWEATFEKLGFRITDAKTRPLAGIFLQTTYVLDRALPAGIAEDIAQDIDQPDRPREKTAP